MAEELTQEQKDVAAKIDGAAGDDKSKLDKIGEGVSAMTDLLKSQVENKEKKVIQFS